MNKTFKFLQGGGKKILDYEEEGESHKTFRLEQVRFTSDDKKNIIKFVFNYQNSESNYKSFHKKI